jgi:hypothetical protein
MVKVVDWTLVILTLRPGCRGLLLQEGCCRRGLVRNEGRASCRMQVVTETDASEGRASKLDLQMNISTFFKSLMTNGGMQRSPRLVPCALPHW